MSDEPIYVKSIAEYFDVLKRRKLWLLIPLLTIFPMAVFVAFYLPATYQSQATILIEEQEIPSDFVRSTITSYAAQQVQVVSKRVLTRDNIAQIIKEFELYQVKSEGEAMPGVRLTENFRSNVQLDLVSADVIDPRSRRSTQATIAFTLGFQDADPAIAQSVTEELARLFLNENQRERTEQAESAAEFLGGEAEQLNEELLDLEKKLAEFKSANEGNLPQSYQFNVGTLERTQRELEGVRLRLRELQSRRIEVSGRISQVSPTAPVVLQTGEVVMSDTDRLKALQSEYRKKVARYRENHPDVIRLEREIAALKAELGVGDDVDHLRRQLTEQQQKLADLLTRYNDNHQEVISTRRVIDQLERNLRNAKPTQGSAADPVADNPAYVMLQTELETLESEIRSLNQREQELQKKVIQFEELLKEAPEVERKYQALQRHYESTTREYREIKAKQREALLARNLEQELKGQHFVLVQPPALPEVPISPNRPAIIFLGFIVASAVGIGLVLLREVTDSAIHGARELSALMGEAPLAVIPYIDNDMDILKRRRGWIIAVASTLLGLAALYYLWFFLAR